MALIASSSAALWAARDTATWNRMSISSIRSSSTPGASIASMVARIASRSAPVRASAANRTQPSSIHTRASLISFSVVEPALNHSATASPSVAATRPGSGRRTNVPPPAPREDSTSCEADSSFIVSRIVPRLTE
jgi:hypothetical protein